jgi:hypothetical protein
MKCCFYVLATMLFFGFASTTRAQWVYTGGPPGGVSTLAVSGEYIFAGVLVPDNEYGILCAGVYRSTDNGTTWEAVNNGLPRNRLDTTAFRHVFALAVASDGTGGTYLFAGVQGSGVFRSTNNGTDWVAANTGISRNYYDTTGYSDIAAFAVSPNGLGGTNLFAGAGGDYGAGVFLSTDNGARWTSVNNGLPTNPYDTTTYRHVGVLEVCPDGRGGTNLFASFWFPDVYGGYGAGVYRSTDNGTSWTALNIGFVNSVIGAFAASPDTAGGTNLFAGGGTFGTSADVLRSTDYGTTWTAATTGLPTDTFVLDLAVTQDGSVGVDLFAGTYGAGVFCSTNNGTSWTEFNAGLTSTKVRFLAVSHNAGGGTDLIAGTDENGVWKRPLKGVTSALQGNIGSIPQGFTLYQNYPNPFNPTTTIHYALPVASRVSLIVFNTLGQQVATLVQGEQGAGVHEVRFDASHLSSGVYLSILRAGDFLESQRLLLLR